MVGPLESEWTPCPPGELTRLARRLRRLERQRWIVPGAALLVLFVAAGLGLRYWLVRPREYTFAGLTCSQVKSLMPAYVAGTLRPDLRARVRDHARQCPGCRPAFEQMGLLATAAPSVPDRELNGDIALALRQWAMALPAKQRSRREP